MRIFCFFALFFFFIPSAFTQFGTFKDISGIVGYATNIEAFDFDNDGDEDVFVTFVKEKKVVYFENNNGTIDTNINVVGENLEGLNSLISTDLNNDGWLDIVVGLNGDFTWYSNEFGMNFVQQAITSTGSGSVELSSVDMDNDGDQDILLSSGSLAWSENNGQGIFTHHVIDINSYPTESVSLDFDLDGDNDVVSCLQSGVKVYSNAGNQSFSVVSQPNIPPSYGWVGSCFSGDVDGDGLVDIITSGLNGISWFRNLGNLVFGAQQVILSAPGIWQISVGDINDDGEIDVIGIDDESIYVYTNSSGTFSLSQTFQSNSKWLRCLTLSDINNDGDLDIYLGDAVDTRMSWVENNANLLILENQFWSQEFGVVSPTVVKTCDVDNDGDLDVISSSGYNKELAWYENQGNGTFSDQQIISDTIYSFDLLVADVNNDGYCDIICEHNGLTVVWFENNAGISFNSPSVIAQNFDNLVSMDIGDIDNDGDVDVLFVNNNWSPSNPTSDVVWYENLGGGTWSSENVILQNYFTQVKDAAFSDTDQDSDLDVIVAINGIRLYKNDLGVFSADQWLVPEVTDYIHIMDVDADGADDIVFRLDGNPMDLLWSRNTGSNVYSLPIIITDSAQNSYSSKLHSTDIDGDGDLDLFLSREIVGMISWFENEGGSFISEHIVCSNLPFITNIDSGDLDGDGDPDLVAARSGLERIVWHENYFNSSFQLKGTFYFDENQNAIRDSSDMSIAVGSTTIQPLGISSFSSNGNYIHSADSATYVVSYSLIDSLWGLTTDSLTYTRTLNSYTPLHDSLDFGFYPDSTLTEVSADLTAGFPRCNQLVNFWMSVTNNGTTLPSGLMKLELDPSINYISAQVPLDSIVGNSLYWSFDSLFFYSSQVNNIVVEMPNFQSVNDTLISALTIYHIDSLGALVESSTDTLSQILVCAYDPNDKTVTPEGSGEEGFISINGDLEYLIRFQNTGTDTAFNVKIQDNIDLNLDINTITSISASHPFILQIEPDRDVIFNFDNIQLPDSTTNELGSQGFIKFKVSQLDNLVPLTEIRNFAEIYFDYNPPIITNDVLNTIECNDILLPEVFLLDTVLTSTYADSSYLFHWFRNDTILLGGSEEFYHPIQNGNYSIQIEDAYGCLYDSEDYYFGCVGVTSPLVSFINDSIFIELPGSYGYQWFLNDTAIIGATDFYHLPNINGSYSATLMDSNNCVLQSDYHIYNSASLVADESLFVQANIYPNPFDEVVYIQLMSQQLEEKVDLIVLDNLGKEVKTLFDISDSLIKIRKSDIGTGVFHIYLRESSGVLNPLGKLVSY
ncbi:MAG: VCBS repeat-containing protein [Flavobacteriales bacterium]|nr:VCBS repeat-containing protein [Flavobacteriales bacterium]